MKTIKMKKNASGPNFNFLEGKEYTVDDAVAEALEAGGACLVDALVVALEAEPEVIEIVEVEKPKPTAEEIFSKPKKLRPGKV